MDSFTLIMRRLQFFVFSVLAGLLLGTTYLLVRMRTTRPTATLGITLIIVWASFAAYLYTIYFSRLSQKTKYLIKAVPIILICLGFSLIIIIGFIQYVTTTEGALRFRPPAAEPGDVVAYAWYGALALLACSLLMPVITLIATMSILRMLRARHHIDGSTIRFHNHHKDWEIDLREVRSVVLGETNVVACKDIEEEDLALDVLNRPYQLSFVQRPLDGVLYLDNDQLIRDAQAAGLEVKQERLATIIKESTPSYRRRKK
ncbi:hypothetical protein JXA12_00640 [Candidatus Woesearchaeota archaeon]|nr:hypothetical protein [Candidatus Woesearchaeota archaeon]